MQHIPSFIPPTAFAHSSPISTNAHTYHIYTHTHTDKQPHTPRTYTDPPPKSTRIKNASLFSLIHTRTHTPHQYTRISYIPTISHPKFPLLLCSPCLPSHGSFQFLLFICFSFCYANLILTSFTLYAHTNTQLFTLVMKDWTGITTTSLW